MIQDLKPYPRYMDLGVEWLGNVPEHWRILSAFAGYRPKRVRNLGMTEKTVLSLSYGHIVIKPQSALHGLVPESYETYQVIDPGDIVVRTTDLQNDHTSLRIGYSETRGIITSAYMNLETRDILLSKFGYQVLNAYDLLKIIYGFGSGLRQSLDFGDLKRMPIPVPSKHEQFAIVRFLGYMDRRIRRNARTKEKLISLLNEQKQAIIHQAVTRGLDANVPLKPSGMEWLGDVPEHWSTVPLGRCLRGIDQGWSPVAAEGEISADQWVVLALSSIRHGAFHPGEIKPISIPAKDMEKIEITDGDLLLTRSNTRELVGDVCIVQGVRPKTIISDLIYRLRVDSAMVDRRYLMYELLSRIGRYQIERDARGSSSSMPKISQQRIRSWRVILPPIDEQQSIVAALDGHAQRINAAVQGVQEEISFLREYRYRLIADLVTGKLDVREAVARLPEEPDEPDESDWNQEAEETEPLDDTEEIPEGDGETEGTVPAQILEEV